MVSVVVFAVLQLGIMTGLVNNYQQSILTYACIFATYALGLNVIYGYNGQFSLGHAAFYGIGAYASALVTKQLFGGAAYSLPLALLTGGLVAAVLGFVIGLPILRLRSDYLGIATLGFGVMVKVLFDNADAVIPAMGGSRGMTGIPKLTTFAWAFFVLVAAVILVRNLVYSSHGRAVVSIREDEIAADTMGIDTTRYKTLAFVVGCFLAGVAGSLYAHLYVFLHPSNFDFLKSVDVLMVVVLGGLGSITGTIVAAIGWVFLLEGLRVVLPMELLDWRMVIYPLVMIIVMIARPRGLMGGIEYGPLRQGRASRRPALAETPPAGGLPQEEVHIG
ncbi:MAG: branched-chain amino acid ABC transporter permease [Dehalococcoidales bacterium]|nr:branched-chain amino acid ABC transporter permease [Dehalococcoidales bacterium]